MFEKMKFKVNFRIFPAIAAWMFFFRAYIPLLLMTEYNHSSQDDFWMSNNVYHVWRYTEDFWKTISRGFIEAVNMWKNWDGCFLSMFIGNVPPSVFGEEYYKYTFIVLSIALIIAIISILYVILVRVFKFDFVHYLIITPIILLFLTNMLPSIKEGLYWWVGGINYMLFFAIFLISQALLVEYMVSKKKAYLVIGSVVSFCVGLGNLLTALVNPIIVVLEFVFLAIRDKKKSVPYLAPVICSLVGLLFNVLAPGNLIRGGAGLFENSPIDAIIGTISLSTTFITYFYRPTMWCMFLAIVVTVFDGLNHDRLKFEFKYPLVFLILSYLVYCATFTPVIYAGSAIYGRCKNVSFGMQIFFYLLNIIYLGGWLHKKWLKDKFNMVKHLLVYFAVFFMVMYCYKYRSNMDFFLADHYLSTGIAKAFDEQVNARYELYYDAEVSDVEVKKVTGIPPLFYWDDECIDELVSYFDKNSITVVE